MKRKFLKIGIIFYFLSLFTVQVFSQITSVKSVSAESRKKISLNNDWKFSLENSPNSNNVSIDESKWTNINLPHTWNTEDAFDDQPGYLQTTAWYRKKIKIEDSLREKRLFLYFEGVGQIADVYINGKLIGNHIGGYTAFVFDITEQIVRAAPDFENVLAVRVSNVSTDNIPPSATADFNFYGGIYRDVYLIATDPVHISVTDYASPGVYIDTPQVSEEKALVRFKGKIINDSRARQKIKVKNSVLDKENVKIADTESVFEIEEGTEIGFEQTISEIKKPNLWSPASPYLYQVITQVYDENNRVLDEVKNPLGFRWFSFDAEKGFFLNGKPLKLVGGNRHQDYQGLGNALPDELHVKDLEIIKKAGMNWVLLAHYPHDPAILEAADRLGLIVWEETPILRQINTSPLYAKISEQMLIEMIRQHYNHPSVVFWCYMNEIFLRMKSEKDYVQKTAELTRTLEKTAKREDPNRLTAISFNRPYTETNFYEESGMTQISDVIAWHLYFGWYYGKPEDLGEFLDDYHRRYPQRRLLVSEYGADSDSRIHSIDPQVKDYSTEWAQVFHEKSVAQMKDRPYLGGFAVWNMFDFGSEMRGESVPHINKKGIYKINRESKDIAFFYQAQFADQPVLHIASREWSKRAAEKRKETSKSSEGNNSVQPIKIYTNLPEIELLVNGKSLGKKITGETKTILWEANLQDGINKIEARGQFGNTPLTDKTEIQYVLRRKNNLNQLIVEDLAINAGGETSFFDGDGTLWEADREYTPGDWGYVGGETEKSTGKTERNIFATEDDPLYQSFRQNFSAYRFDIPDGEYEIELGFAEPLLYKPGERIFSISANGVKLIENFDVSKESGFFKALVKTFKIKTNGGKGLMLEFQANKSLPIINALRLRRLGAK